MNKQVPEQLLNEERAARVAAEKRAAALEQELETLRASLPGPADQAQTAEHANNRLMHLISNLQNAILAADENRKVVIVNELFCRQFGITSPPASLIGTDSLELLHGLMHLFKEPGSFSDRVNELVGGRETVLNDELETFRGDYTQQETNVQMKAFALGGPTGIFNLI